MSTDSVYRYHPVGEFFTEKYILFLSTIQRNIQQLNRLVIVAKRQKEPKEWNSNNTTNLIFAQNSMSLNSM